MKNTLQDLNNYLFESLERLVTMEDDISDEQMQKEIKRSEAITDVAESIIHNAELALKTMDRLYEYGIEGFDKVPRMLELVARDEKIPERD